MPRYYHVIKRPSGWCLYADDALKETVSDPDVRVVLRAARAAARRDGGRVVLHKDPAAEAGRDGAASTDDSALHRPRITRTLATPHRRGRRTGLALPTSV